MHGDIEEIKTIKVEPRYKYVNPFRWIALLTAIVGASLTGIVSTCCMNMPKTVQLVVPPEKTIEASNHAIKMVEATKAWDTNNERLMSQAIEDAVKIYGQPVKEGK